MPGQPVSNQQPMVVIGSSTGGLAALKSVLAPLPIDFPAPILVAQHLLPVKHNRMNRILDESIQLPVSFAQNGQSLKAGQVYLAQPDYHLRVNQDLLLMLSQDEKVMFSRPSIDVLFFSVARLKNFKITAIILTGANRDGAAGAKAIQNAGGRIIVQDPESAEAPIMPQAVIDLLTPDGIIWLDQIGSYLWDSVKK